MKRGSSRTGPDRVNTAGELEFPNLVFSTYVLPHLLYETERCRGGELVFRVFSPIPADF